MISLEVRTNLDDGAGVIKRNDKDITDNAIMHQNAKKEEIPYISVLNKLLPDDIRVLAWTPVSLDFKARYYIHCFVMISSLK